MSDAPRVEALIAKVMNRFPGESETSNRRYFEAVHQELAPLARRLETENKLLRNVGSRMAACLFDYHDTCPECGNRRSNHMQGCKQTYEREFKGPQDSAHVFELAFDFEAASNTERALRDRIHELETWQRTICELLAPAGDEVRPKDAHDVVNCLREMLANEEEAHAQLQERCFGQGGQSVFDEVKQLRAELAEIENDAEPVAHVRAANPVSGRNQLEFATDIHAIDDSLVGAKLYRDPRRTIKPDEATRGRVMDAIAEAIGDAYDCTRVWSAWGFGTMGPDDFQSVAGDASRVAEIADAAIAAIIADSPAMSETSPTGWDAEFLAKRLGRVARLLDVTMPFQDDDKNAEVAGTILAEIARRIEERTAATTHCKFVLLPTWRLIRAADVLDRDGDEYGIAAKLRDMASAKPPLAPTDSQILEWLSIARNDDIQLGDRLQRLICRMEPVLAGEPVKEQQS